MKKEIIVSINKNSISCDIELPASKSLSNRVLMIEALCHEPFVINNLSEADDTKLLHSLLNKIKEYENQAEILLVDCGEAATVARFLTSYLALKAKGTYKVTGSPRLLQRPMKALVNSLSEMGCQITYIGEEGFLPLIIKPSHIHKNEVYVDTSQSSQFASALLLCAPAVPGGLTITTSHLVASKPYLDMTASLMSYFGVEVKQTDNAYIIPQQPYKPDNITIEADWSAASYWYELAALAKDAEITLKGLRQNSLQGDNILVSLFENVGVSTTFNTDSITLSKCPYKSKVLEYNFIHTPDIFPAALVTCALLNQTARFGGLHNLRFKESDRLQAVLDELRPFGVSSYFDACKSQLLLGKNNITMPSKIHVVKTYNDHRMAMAFAMVAAYTGKVIIDDALTVNKSYPDFWLNMQQAGFEIKDNI